MIHTDTRPLDEHGYFRVPISSTELSVMPHLSNFIVPKDHFVNADILEEMGTGRLLPAVTNIQFGVLESDIELAFKMLESRLLSGGSSVSAIREASLYCDDVPRCNLDSARADFLVKHGVNILFNGYSVAHWSMSPTSVLPWPWAATGEIDGDAIEGDALPT